MRDFGTVTVYTQVYNTKPYLVQCIDSVLSQTYANFEYILVDNGCTDGSSEILNDFAQRDHRIHLVRYENNRQGFWRDLINQYSTGTYFTLIDSDDWWEVNYLEQLITMAEENQLDIVCTGCIMHYVASGEKYLRCVQEQLLFSRRLFSNALPVYHQFFRTSWGKLVRMDVFKKVGPQTVPVMPYGGDTADCFQLLRHAQSIGLDTSALYHYRVHSKSVSYQYDARRFDTDIYLYYDAIDFLQSFGPISSRNYQFLYAVYSNAVFETIQVIHNSSLQLPEKLHEYRTIALNPLTQTVYRQCQDESARQSHDMMIRLVLLAGKGLGKDSDEDLRVTLQGLLPHCGLLVTGKNVELFFQDNALFDTLLADNPEAMLTRLLELIGKNQYIRKYNLSRMVQALVADNPFLHQITDTVFLRKYPRFFLAVRSGEYLQTLEEMAGLLIEGRVNGGKETFLNLFLLLAAVLEEASAFVFGKFQLAELLLSQNRREECEAVLSDLDSMGLSDNEELQALHAALDRKE